MKGKGMSKVTVTFSQKVSEQPYETADYSLILEQEVGENEDPIVVAEELFAQAKYTVLKQAGSQYDLSPDGVVMRRLETGVRPAGNTEASPAPQASPSVPSGPTAASAAVSATAAAPAPLPPAGGGGRVTGRVYPRTQFAVGKDADRKQLMFNILAFHPAMWSDGRKAYEVKEHADGSTDKTQRGTNYPNFSISKDALALAGFHSDRDQGLWINDGDSNVPLMVWDQLGGQTQEDAVEWDWQSRRAELQQFAGRR